VADVDLGAIRHRILGRAVAASRDREPQKRFSVKRLFRAHLRARYDPSDSATFDSEPAVTEAEIFQTAYGDPLGRDYWRAWLSEPFQPLQIAELIATHAAASEPLFQCIEGQIFSVLLTANFADTSSAIDWLIDTPRIANLIPASLCEYLSGAWHGEAESKTGAETGQPDKKTGRPSGTGYARQDERLIDEMYSLLYTGKAKSSTEAASTVIGKDGERAPGGGTRDAKIARLVKRARERKTKEK
jgi:hypothetical protein